MGGPSLPPLAPLPDQAGRTLLFGGHWPQAKPIGRADHLWRYPVLMSLGLDGHISILSNEGPESEIRGDVHDPRLKGDLANCVCKRLRAVPEGREDAKLFDRPIFLRNGTYEVLDGVMDAGFGGIKDLGGPSGSPHRMGLNEQT